MPDKTSTPTDPNKEPKEWTLMFYFASDNPLAPNVVSQLKAIKNAGFHNDVNVITKFDPNTPGTPTHIFDVNLPNKLTATGNGFHVFPGNDPFVRSLVMDKLWGDNAHGKAMRGKIAEHLARKEYGADYNPPTPPLEDEPSPKKSLRSFLDFCAKNYPARHYMLLILGHGLVVGNHMFLYDAVADEASLSMLDLARALTDFNEAIEGYGELELLGFHSCSMSSLELAYELKGTANYMLASQGPNFVGSWPYREICVRVFNDQPTEKHPERRTPKETIVGIFHSILSNSFDFNLAGYSFDLALCDLQQTQNIKPELTALSALLIDALKSSADASKSNGDASESSDDAKSSDPLLMDLILLAHWEAQSYWQESYTDLLDFCACLKKRCDRHVKWAPAETSAKLKLISTACSKVLEKLKPQVKPGEVKPRGKSVDDKFIVKSEFAGPEFQYSQGLSVYFPWSQPSDKRFWPTEYSNYQFKETGWGEFLGHYFKLTQRKSVGEEIEKARGVPAPPLPLEQELLGEMLPEINLDVLPVDVATGNGKEIGVGVSLGAGDKTGGADALGAGDKTGGADALGAGDKTGGADALGAGDKTGGASALGAGDKTGGASALGAGDKTGGASALGAGDKTGGASALGAGDKTGGASALGGDCDCSSIKNYPKYTRLPPTSPDFFDDLRQSNQAS